MLYWFDTEFIDDGDRVDLISIGIVSEDGRTYYAQSLDCDLNRACEWVQKNVIVHLTGEFKPEKQIRDEIVKFCGERPIFWGYYADYDWFLMCKLFGGMLKVPPLWPNFCLDIQQARYLGGVLSLPKQNSAEHNALNDAIWTRDCYYFLKQINKL